MSQCDFLSFRITRFIHEINYTRCSWKITFLSKKVKLKDKVDNFVAVPRESVSRLSDRFTGFIRNVPNHHIYHKSLKEYFYRGKDDKKTLC